MKLRKINSNALEVEDLYSTSMFLLYKLNNIPEYSILSELPYILNKDDLLKFCGYFGGMTIKVPTVKEIEKTFKVIMFYQYLIIDNKPKEKIQDLMILSDIEYQKLKNEVERLEPMLNNYCSNLKKSYE